MMIFQFRQLAFIASLLITSHANAVRADEISIVQWGVAMPGAVHAVAKDKGFYKKAGVDITGFIASAGGGTAVRNLFGGGLQYAEAGPAAAIAAFQSGLDVRIVNISASVADYIWVTMPNSKIQSFKDAAGARIAVTNPKSSSEMMTIMALEAVGVSIDKVKFVYAGGLGAALTALEGGGADIALLLEPMASMRPGRYRKIADGSKLLPDLVSTIGIATTAFMKSDPAKLRAILAARKEGVEFMSQNPDESGIILAKHYTSLSIEVATQAIKNMNTAQYFSKGAINLQALKNVARGLELIGAVNAASIDWGKLVDESFLPEGLMSKP